MRILHTVESYYPEIGGMPEVVRQLSERLVKLGHEVTVVAKHCDARPENMLNGVKIKAFRIEGNSVTGITGEVDEYRNFLLNSDFDIVTNFAAQQWATDIALPLLDKIKGKKVNVPTGFSGLYWPGGYKQYYEKMKTFMKAYDMNVFLSNNYRDINFARANGITKNIIIPNGAAADEFLPESKMDIRKKLGIREDEFMILHIGTYSKIKGHLEALKIFLKSKIKNGVMVFIGFDNHHFQNYIDTSRKYKLWKFLNRIEDKKFIITALSREETVAAYKAADLFLFPSNIECSPIVLFEAMASKTPFLSTNVGNSVEIVEWSDAGLIMPTVFDKRGLSHPKMNAAKKMLNKLYDDKKQRESLAEKGFAIWEKKFSWEVIAKRYEAMYLDLLK